MTDQTSSPTSHSVFAKIAAVQGAIARVGIGKNRKNNSPGGNYNFRGIDDVYNALAPLLAEHRLCILPRMLSREVVERKSNKGNPLFYVTVDAEFDFVSAEDGSMHTVRTFGEAMDSSDKATNKAMSAAFKYAAFMTFAIPTEGDNDADATTHDIQSEVLSDKELSRLQQLARQTETDLAKIKETYGVRSLRNMRTDDYDHVISILERRAERMLRSEPEPAKQAA